ncbi:hypothetical protein L3X38_040752 [Prunus dulcis]|uniref:DNA recombination and repair protein Rad51-like C-terminal domain-containing protein n=1 Tax=Prunus dulcis TaxID=3755 RepID=A0AAD4URB1_PRUDU|nr:hypothetical protein L3X38_040752 [Prunus dulcis]
MPNTRSLLGGWDSLQLHNRISRGEWFWETQLCLQLTKHLLPLITPALPVKLIVIDSIAALFRSQYQTTPADLKRRSEMFFNISGTLKGLANKYGLAGGCHQPSGGFYWATSWSEWGEVGKLGVLDTSGRRVSPALGLAWAHCINSRVFLARHEQSIEVDIRNAPSTSICSQTHRTFHLVFAPTSGLCIGRICDKKEGIVGLSQ